MSHVGRACALGAVALAVVTVAFWDRGSPQVSSTSQVDGAELFRAKGCASCHDGPDSSALIYGFPSLLDANDWAGQRRAEMTAQTYLAESINEPSTFISPSYAGGNGPTTAMPSLALSSDEVDALIDYLLSK